jgi:hypothetical protein
MTEQETTVEVKKELPAEEIFQRSLNKMPARQLSNHLRRRARDKKVSLMDGAWASVLSIVFDNTEPQGKQTAYLR